MTSRREQLHASNRKRIFLAARDIVASEGASAVNVRRVAAEIGYTAPIVYQHFADKSDLLDAVMIDAYDRLAATLRDAVMQDPHRSPRALVDAYLGFAEQHRRMFLFMHGMGGVDVPTDRRLAAAHGVIAVTEETLAEWVRNHPHAPSIDIMDQAQILWAVSMGLAATAFALPDGLDRIKILTDLAVEPLLASWAGSGA
ncbi:TetR/AcrR family transcriptional regulator [Microbacterium sp. Yaish 1]|uniref:TetR/AcrR family transcriptional regulator n=1 Tax=Microbacterium sp. Yaish 1 TaxID=2025014 RepID=UPI000B93FA0D|nr:TetR/AcrR family transcriptional regulator [Microbacterium sp. Yaish 1]OYC98395.1 hypothetical protein CI089_07985 [Microbacterium sp. Yaish 1]